jgi:hypothetical protein
MNLPMTRPEADERDERHRRDAFGRDVGRYGASEGSRVTSATTIGSGPGVGRPGRVALDGAAVGVGEAAERLEPHDAVGVEQQDGRAGNAEPVGERIEGGVVDLLDRARAADRVRQSETDVVLTAVRRAGRSRGRPQWPAGPAGTTLEENPPCGRRARLRHAVAVDRRRVRLPRDRRDRGTQNRIRRPSRTTRPAANPSTFPTVSAPSTAVVPLSSRPFSR